jgi:hypothetical protein
MAAPAAETTNIFPLPSQAYPSIEGHSLFQSLVSRATQEPFNLVALILFLLAITHTFLTPFFLRLAHRVEEAAQKRLSTLADPQMALRLKAKTKFKTQMLHFLGEVEAVFGIWVIPLILLWILVKGWPSAKYYLDHSVNFTEPVFVVVIMTMAASRPVLDLAERLMALAARLGGGGLAAWWFAILTIGPLLGSLITEPAAMTLSALLLARKFYDRQPPTSFAYATLGLLFVNVSIGGTLTHFAAPPVLMVSAKWGWSTGFMFLHFGWKSILSIVLCNTLFLLYYRKTIAEMGRRPEPATEEGSSESIPLFVTGTSLAFIFWTVINSHHPILFIGGFLFYLAFAEATEPHQDKMRLRPAMLVGFFLAGLVVHGGLQGWWLEPVLGSLTRIPLFIGATVLTAFNDNAAITYLASLVPEFTDPLKYAVVAGAVTGGGLTVIANAPNPAGQSILARYFPGGISPLKLFLGAAIPTVIAAACFWLP